MTSQGWEHVFGNKVAEDLEAILDQDLAILEAVDSENVFGGTDGAYETGEEDRGES